MSLDLNKDREILRQWVLEAEEIAHKQGFKRLYKMEPLLDEFMSEKHLFNTEEDEKEQVLTVLVKTFSDIEKLSQHFDKNLIKLSNYRMMEKVCGW
ncbi:MAG: hypothetical protein AABX03_02160 [Nanoarchaeota archaeon]